MGYIDTKEELGDEILMYGNVFLVNAMNQCMLVIIAGSEDLHVRQDDQSVYIYNVNIHVQMERCYLIKLVDCWI